MGWMELTEEWNRWNALHCFQWFHHSRTDMVSSLSREIRPLAAAVCTPKSELYEAYEGWVASHGLEAALGRNDFHSRLRRAYGGTISEARPRSDEGRMSVWQGIRLRETGSAA